MKISKQVQENIDNIKVIIGNLEKRELKNSELKDEGLKVEYHKELNNEQYTAATAIEGKYLVIAGAGSGKTHMLTRRVSYMLENDINPANILMISFTRKAANEMQDRVKKLLGPGIADNMTISTFHGFCNMIIAKYGSLIGIPSNYNIIDTIDSSDIISMVRGQLGIKGLDGKSFPKSSLVFGIISKSKNKNTSIDKIIRSEHTGIVQHIESIKRISREYTKWKQKKNLLDYDDLITYTLLGLQSNPQFRNMLSTKYRHVMVDEYQDTNLNQKNLIDLIVDKTNNLMVVGDDSQSIYGFRGANYENILRFGETYPSAHIIKLESNYRSNKGIVDFINGTSDAITLGYKKTMNAINEEVLMPNVVNTPSVLTEASFVVDKIVNSGSLENSAVIYRSSQHGNLIQAELLKKKIPFRVYGGIRFNERRQVRDVVAFLRIVNNPMDSIAMYRSLKLIYGIGDVTAHRIINALIDNDFDFLKIKSKARSYGAELMKMMALLDKLYNTEIKYSVKELVVQIKAYYTPLLMKLEEDWEERIKDIDTLELLADQTTNLHDYVTEMVLDPLSQQEKDTEMVTLTTVHSSKGLEWENVFVINCLDGLFPSERALRSFNSIEEERRLWYVACSRAKENLYLSVPSSVSTYSGFYTDTTRFINEIPKGNYKTICR